MLTTYPLIKGEEKVLGQFVSEGHEIAPGPI